MRNKNVKNVGIVLGCSVVAKILSYVWEAMLAAFFGVSDQADVFYMTTSVFGILYPILDMGIWKVFLPIYKTKLVKKEENKAETMANISITFFFLTSIALVLFMMVFARMIVSVMAPGFEAEKKALTIHYLRIAAPAYLLMTTASIIGAILQSRDKFLGSQVREIGSHVSRITCLLFSFHFWGIYGALIALIVGSVFRVLIQLPFINWKWRFKPNFNFKDEDVRTMIKGLPSVAITTAIFQLNDAIDKIVASGVSEGSVASLNYGYKLMSVFSGMISTAIATAVYPTMIQYIAQKDDEKLKTIFGNIINALMFCIIPISVFCFLFSNELVTVAFQRGAFDADATKLTASIFCGYCLGMLFIGISTIVTNVYYGFGDTKKTMYVSIVEIALNIAFDLCLVNVCGVAGLAYATSVSAIICLCIRFVFLKKFLSVNYGQILSEGVIILVIAIVSCMVPYALTNYVIHLNAFLALVIDAVTCGILFFGLACLLRLKAFYYVRSMISGVFKRGGEKA